MSTNQLIVFTYLYAIQKDVRKSIPLYYPVAHPFERMPELEMYYSCSKTHV